MSEKFEAKEVYCPDCDEDYRVAWSEGKEALFVVCGCGEAEEAHSFVDRFQDEYDGATQDNPRGYQ